MGTTTLHSQKVWGSQFENFNKSSNNEFQLSLVQHNFLIIINHTLNFFQNEVCISLLSLLLVIALSFPIIEKSCKYNVDNFCNDINWNFKIKSYIKYDKKHINNIKK